MMSATHRPPDSIDRVREAQRFGRGILPEVSRTFAISIKALPGVLGDAVCTAYLLCRIADTIEDDNTTAPEQRAAWLDAFLTALDDAAAADAFPAQVRALQGDPAHLRLVQHTDLVLVAFRALPPRTRDRVAHWVREMGRGMAKFVRTYPRGIRIQTLPEYREYCYYVAGTVGCMLTELWHEHVPAVGRREFDRLWSRCQTFGEALQSGFKTYAQQVVANAQALAARIQERGIAVVSGGTDNHIVLLDLRSIGMTGKVADLLVSDVHITANKNTVPFDPESPFVTSGLRLGTAAMTTRGFDEAAFAEVADVIADRLLNPDDSAIEQRCRDRVAALCERFPLYGRNRALQHA